MTGGGSSIPAVQRLLRVLAAGRRVAEIGTAYGDGAEAILPLVEPGGLVVKDDLTPGREIEGDSVREFLLRDPRLAAVEILTTPATVAILATRL